MIEFKLAVVSFNSCWLFYFLSSQASLWPGNVRKSRTRRLPKGYTIFYCSVAQLVLLTESCGQANAQKPGRESSENVKSVNSATKTNSHHKIKKSPNPY